MHNTQIYWDGESPKIVKKADLVEYLKTYPPGSWFNVIVTPLGSSNNTDQSRLYHKWTDIIARELGWGSGNEVHKHFKEQFNNGESTKGFDTIQWSEYMMKVSAFAGDYRINLPLGNG